MHLDPLCAVRLVKMTPLEHTQVQMYFTATLKINITQSLSEETFNYALLLSHYLLKHSPFLQN